MVRFALQAVSCAVVAILVLASPGDARPMVYTCSSNDVLQCEAEFIACSEKRQSRQSKEANCRCWTDSYVCFRDCNAFPGDWADRCIEECDNKDCDPPEYGEAAAASATANVAGLVLAGAAALLAGLRPRGAKAWGSCLELCCNGEG